MNGFNLISAIRRGVWLIDNSWVDQNITLIERVLAGGSFSANTTATNVGLNFTSEANAVTYHPIMGWKDVPKGSVAVHYIIGPILQYGVCGPGTADYQAMFISADRNPNIIGHVFVMNTPGGQADGITEFVSTLQKSAKPKVGYIDGGMLASGGMWIASTFDAIYASSDLVDVGSIGAYQTLVDDQVAMEREGYRIIKIKARQSVDKGKIYEDAIAGDETALKKLEDEVSYLAGHFITAVKTGRGDRLTSDEWNTGKMYSTKEALKIGLIDGISSLEYIVNSIPNYTSSKNTKSNMKFNNVSALAGQDQVTQEALDLANADLTGAGITHVTLVEQSVLDEAARVTSELATAQEQLAAVNSSLATHVAAVAEKDAKIAALEGVIANRAAVATTTAAVANATETAEIETDQAAPLYSHNKVADNGIFGN